MPRDKWGRVIEDKKPKFVKPFKPRGGLYNSHLKTRPVRKETQIRNPVKYLVEKYNMPKKYAKEFLEHPGLDNYWKRDSSGRYMDKETLDSIAYGWRKERKEFKKSMRPPISPYMKKKYEKTLFPQVKIPSDMRDDPMLKRWIQKFEEVKQHLEETGADKESRMKAIKKLRKEFTKDLLKRYPEDKVKIEQSAKKMEKDFVHTMRLKELLEIGSKRYYTKKKSEELRKLGETKK